MKPSTALSLVLSLLPLATAVPAPAAATGPSLAESESQFESLVQQANEATLDALDDGGAVVNRRAAAKCTSKNISIRREFGSLSKAERKAYTDAVLCLQKLPAKTPASIAAGAKSRFDDFVVTHIQQTTTIHYTGTFLAWHRYYIYIYEQALKTECGYKGALPYWEWSKWADAPQNSPLFNGDAYSMSGNGEFVPGHQGPLLQPAFDGLGSTPIQLAAGLGGGCVTSGPFKNYTVNLGPIGVQDVPVGPDGGLGHNPRCMKRDIGPGVATTFCNWNSVLHVMKQKTLEDFQFELQGRPGSGSIGPHGGGHYTIGGDPGGDLFTSPSDPAFYLHHGQIDRVWTVWQALNPTYKYALSGTNTFLNSPPSANTTLTDPVSFGFAGGATLQMKDLLSTTAGPFCYMYL